MRRFLTYVMDELGWIGAFLAVFALGFALGVPGAKGFGPYERVTPINQWVSAGAGQIGLSVAALASLTPPAIATWAQICPATGTVVYRDDGTAPTASSGMPLTCMQYFGPLGAIQFISTGGAATIDVLYYVASN